MTDSLQGIPAPSWRQVRRTVLLTLLPIFVEERDLEVRFGVPELLRRFAQANVTTVVDVSRVNVANQS